MTSGAYLGEPREAIAGTLALLKHFRAFLRSPDDQCLYMRDPTQPRWQAETLDKRQARELLTRLVDVAINRKAGIPDADRYAETIMRRDRDRIEDYLFRRYRHTGCRGLLGTRRLQRRYPNINNQPADG